MPTPYVEKLAKKHGMSVDEAESEWKKAKKDAADSGHSDDYAYITQIFKSRMGETAMTQSTKIESALLFDLGREITIALGGDDTTWQNIQRDVARGLLSNFSRMRINSAKSFLRPIQNPSTLQKIAQTFTQNSFADIYKASARFRLEPQAVDFIWTMAKLILEQMNESSDV